MPSEEERRESELFHAPIVDDDETVREKELRVDRVDTIAEAGATVVELAEGEKSWKFGHVIVDEAQDLSPMQWRMVKRRSVGGGMTIVGDLAQRVSQMAENWGELLGEEVEDFTYKELSVNYRSPSEVNEVAARVLKKIHRSLSQPSSLRSSGHPVRFVACDSMEKLADLLVSEVSDFPDTRVAVIHASKTAVGSPVDGVTYLSPSQAKGLEFDSVFVVDVEDILQLPHGLQFLYVALTRSTSRLCVTYKDVLPEVLRL